MKNNGFEPQERVYALEQTAVQGRATTSIGRYAVRLHGFAPNGRSTDGFPARRRRVKATGYPVGSRADRAPDVPFPIGARRTPPRSGLILGYVVHRDDFSAAALHFECEKPVAGV
jgi:hypothetical protein